MIQNIWLVPLFPLIGFLINGTIGRNLPKTFVSLIGSLSILASFLVVVTVFLHLPEAATEVQIFDFINLGHNQLKIPFAFLVDQLSVLMMLVITGVGFLIHIYSAGYMHDDDGFYRFFAYLNLFIFFMLLLVLGSNYVIMFIGWEGVGLCSYLLIGFWFKNQDYNDAAKKAFIMNRIGDLGFLLGVFLIIYTFGTVSYSEVFAKASLLTEFNSPVIIAITLLLFIGATGKSAQLPLYTWLPDAMAGPTPVSALIHAATMVTAGLYMIARSNILYTLAPATLGVIAGIGVATALFAATIGLAQNDIKKVLAYSTVSQLGYMFIAMGLGAYTTGMFHVMTHAFFKALLFLGAGSVIHAMSGEQDIRKMGGLSKHLPVTHLTFLIGTLAIAGIFPFAGFFSKDEILANAFVSNQIIWILGLIGAAMTAFYMFRMYFLTFSGSFRGTQHQHEHLHESPFSMTLPLIVLAGFSIIGGFFNLPEALSLGFTPQALDHFLEPVFAASHKLSHGHVHLEHATEYALMSVSMGIAVVSIIVAYVVYVSKKVVPADESVQLGAIHKLVYNKYYIDEIYEALIVKPLYAISDALYRFVEILGIDGIVNTVAQGVKSLSAGLKRFQTGVVGSYIFGMVIGLVVILVVNLLV